MAQHSHLAVSCGGVSVTFAVTLVWQAEKGLPVPSGWNGPRSRGHSYMGTLELAAARCSVAVYCKLDDPFVVASLAVQAVLQGGDGSRAGRPCSCWRPRRCRQLVSRCTTYRRSLLLTASYSTCAARVTISGIGATIPWRLAYRTALQSQPNRTHWLGARCTGSQRRRGAGSSHALHQNGSRWMFTRAHGQAFAVLTGLVRRARRAMGSAIHISVGVRSLNVRMRYPRSPLRRSGHGTTWARCCHCLQRYSMERSRRGRCFSRMPA